MSATTNDEDDEHTANEDVVPQNEAQTTVCLPRELILTILEEALPWASNEMDLSGRGPPDASQYLPKLRRNASLASYALISQSLREWAQTRLFESPVVVLQSTFQLLERSLQDDDRLARKVKRLCLVAHRHKMGLGPAQRLISMCTELEHLEVWHAKDLSLDDFTSATKLRSLSLKNVYLADSMPFQVPPIPAVPYLVAPPIFPDLTHLTIYESVLYNSTPSLLLSPTALPSLTHLVLFRTFLSFASSTLPVLLNSLAPTLQHLSVPMPDVTHRLDLRLFTALRVLEVHTNHSPILPPNPPPSGDEPFEIRLIAGRDVDEHKARIILPRLSDELDAWHRDGGTVARLVLPGVLAREAASAELARLRQVVKNLSGEVVIGVVEKQALG